MYARCRGPGKPEQADGEPDTSNHGRMQTLFWRNTADGTLSLPYGMALLVDQSIDQYHGQRAQKATCSDGNERQADLLDVEAVNGGVHVLECREEGIEYRETEADVQGPSDDNGFRVKHLDGSK